MNGADVKQFKAFRKRIYDGDGLYVGTAEFVLDMLLKKSTAFARACEIEPVTSGDGKERRAQALWIKAKYDDFAQVAFFDCIKDDFAAAEQIVNMCKRLNTERGIKRLVVGLNGHLSYGVGLLTQTSLKNTFDTCYNKTYYSEFFSEFPVKKTLTAYRCPLAEARAKLSAVETDTDGYSVRSADFKNFRKECETMRSICDRTIGTTYLYSETDENHFYDLLKDMKIIMNGDNLLFLMKDKREVGFLFWHSDYNGAVKSGKPLSQMSFALSYFFNKRKIDTVKLNSIGVEEEHRGRGTLALLRAMDEKIGDGYKYIETNFVWDENSKSRLLNLRLLDGECRKFEVYEAKT